MSELVSPPHGLVERVKNILLKPSEEWAVIDGEPTSVGELYRNYVLPLAAIPPVAALIGSLLFGHSVLGVSYRPSIVGAVGGAVVQYIFALIGVAVIALIIAALAPTFDGAKDQRQAFKVAAYSSTASWVAGIFGLLPAIAWLSLLGLYGLYVLWRSLPRLMKAPPEKATAYTATVVVVAVVVSVLIGVVTAPIVGLFSGIGGTSVADGKVSGTLKVPGVGDVDMAKLEEAGKKLEAAGATGGAQVAVDPALLEGLLPQTLGGLARTSLESSAAAAGGMGGSRAAAVYGAGEQTLTLDVNDMAAMAGLATLTSALNVQTNEQTDAGYERVKKVDGRMTTESWENANRSGRYGVMVAERFMVEASGEGVDMATLKAAVGAVDFAALERAAKSQ